MLILGIETSGRSLEVAVLRDGECLGTRSPAQSGQRHARTLVAEIAAACRDVGIAPRDLDAVAVSIGPGSFTGLRVGVVCAKTLAYATGCKLAAVDTLLAIAAGSPGDVARVQVVSDAQRGELYLGRYERDREGAWRRMGEIAIVDGTAWSSALQADDVVGGPAVDRFAAQLESRCRVLEQPDRSPRAETVARLGAERIGRGEEDDCRRLEPFYLRPSAAEEKAEPGAGSGE